MRSRSSYGAMLQRSSEVLVYTESDALTMLARREAQCVCRRDTGVLIGLISFFTKFHKAKVRIRFALFGVEWLYIRIQASPFTSCIEEVCWLLRLWRKQGRALRCAGLLLNPEVANDAR